MHLCIHVRELNYCSFLFFANDKFLSSTGFSCLLQQSISDVSTLQGFRCHGGSSGKVDGVVGY